MKLSQFRKLILETIKQIIDEEYLDNLSKETEFNRKNKAKNIIVNYDKLLHRVGNKRIRTIIFNSFDPNGSKEKHIQKIRIPELREIIKRKKNQTLEEAIKTSLFAGNINVSCSCPDWKFKGYSYMANIGDYEIEKEEREPNIKNPNLEGSVCKHLKAVFNNIDDYIPKITKDLKNFLIKEKNRKNK